MSISRRFRATSLPDPGGKRLSGIQSSPPAFNNVSPPSAPAPDHKAGTEQTKRQHDQETEADHRDAGRRQLQAPVGRGFGRDVDEAIVVDQPVDDPEAHVQIAGIADVSVREKIAVADYNDTLLGVSVQIARQGIAQRDRPLLFGAVRLEADRAGQRPDYQILVRSASDYPKGGAPISVCPVCKHEAFNDEKRELVMHEEMWRGQPIFLLRTTLYVIVTEALAEKIQKAGATNVDFAPV